VTILDDSVTFTGEIHPYADRWPMRTADEIEAMADSITVNGLRFPIIITPDGVLVDGRNRLRACEVAGVAPRFEVREELAGEDAIVAFIWDANGDRRDMSKGAKAMLAALRPGSQRALSAHSGVAEGYINKARQVIEFCDDTTVEAVIADRLSLNDAYAQAQEIKATVQAEEIAERKRKAEEKAEAERRQRLLSDLKANRPDLAALVDDDKLTLDDALTIRRKDQAAEEQRAHFKAQAIKQRNLDLNVGFSTISELAHPHILAEVLDNWRPLSTDWTPAMLHDLADLLHQIADQWKATA